MKKTILLVFSLASFFAFPTFSQTSSTYKKQPTLSVNFLLNDYRTAQLIQERSVSEVLKHDTWSEIREMFPGLAITYHKGLSDHVDFSTTIGGSYVKYELKNGGSSRSERILLELDANVNVKLLSDKYVVTPYLTAGVGASLYGVHYGAFIPLGFGLQFRLGEDAFLFSNLQYRTGITDFANNHLNYSIGFGAPLGTK
jgi:hypothetical protein